MSEYTQEQFEQLPEFAQKDFVKDGEVYRHAAVVKVKQTANDLDKKLKDREAEFAQLSERLNTFEQQQAEKIEAARKEALEQAKSKGDVDEIEKRYQEQMADLEKRTEERVRSEVTKEFTQKTAAEKAKAIAASLAAEHAVDPDSREVLQELLERRVKIDPETGKEVYYSDEGSALSLDRSGFVSDVLKKSAKYSRLIKSGVVTNSPGNISGSNGEGRAPVENPKAEEARKKGDLNGYLKAQLSQR